MEVEYSEDRGWTINNGVPGYNLSRLPRCCAISKSTGKRCRRAAKKGMEVCGIHAETCRPGRKKGAHVPVKHGLYTGKAIQERKEARDALQALNGLIGAMNHKLETSKQGMYENEI